MKRCLGDFIPVRFARRHELAEFKARGLGGVDSFDLGIRDAAKVNLVASAVTRLVTGTG